MAGPLQPFFSFTQCHQAVGAEVESTGVAGIEQQAAFGHFNAAPAGGAGRLVVGGVADLCVYDPQAEWVINADTLRSQGKHTPFSGYALRAKVRCTIVGGYLAFEA